MRYLLLTVAIWFAAAPLTFAQEKMGQLSGQFVIKGDVPKIIAAVAGDESLLIDEKTGGVANIIVSLWVPPGAKKMAAFAPPKPLPATNVQVKDGRFTPRLTHIMVGSGLAFENKDGLGVAVEGNSIGNAPFAALIPPGAKAVWTLPKDERVPIALKLPAHPAARGYTMVTNHPFVAITDAEGRFTIDGLPPDMYTFRVWHENSGYVENLVIKEKAVKWAKGQFPQAIRAGKNELGTLPVISAEFPVIKARGLED